MRGKEEIAPGISYRTGHRLAKLATCGRVEPEVSAAFENELATISCAAIAISRRLHHVAQGVDAGIDREWSA